jgi:hypothetical protein
MIPPPGYGRYGQRWVVVVGGASAAEGRGVTYYDDVFTSVIAFHGHHRRTASSSRSNHGCYGNGEKKKKYLEELRTRFPAVKKKKEKRKRKEKNGLSNVAAAG